MLQELADAVALPAGDQVLLDVEAAQRTLQVGRVDLDQAAVGVLAEHLAEQVEQIEPRGRDRLGRAVRQLGPDRLGPQLALVERVELGLEVVDDGGDVLGAVLVDQRLGGDLGRPSPLAAACEPSGLGFLTRARTSRSAAWNEIAVPPPPSTRVRSSWLSASWSALASVGVGLGLEHLGDPTPVLRVEHLEAAATARGCAPAGACTAASWGSLKNSWSGSSPRW